MKVKGINFSYNCSKGSKNSRIKAMEEIRTAVYENVIKEFSRPRSANSTYKKEYIPISKLTSLLKEKFPEPINFVVKKIQTCRKKSYDGVVLSCIRNGLTKYYKMEVSAEKNLLPIYQLPTLLHETTHLLDFALQPQYRAVNEKLAQKGLLDKVCDFYSKNLYSSEKVSKHKIGKRIKNFTENMPVEDKLLTLNFFKLHMETEIRAYGASKQYTKKISPWNGKIFEYCFDAP